MPTQPRNKRSLFTLSKMLTSRTCNRSFRISSSPIKPVQEIMDVAGTTPNPVQIHCRPAARPWNNKGSPPAAAALETPPSVAEMQDETRIHDSQLPKKFYYATIKIAVSPDA